MRRLSWSCHSPVTASSAPKKACRRPGVATLTLGPFIHIEPPLIRWHSSTCEQSPHTRLAHWLDRALAHGVLSGEWFARHAVRGLV